MPDQSPAETLRKAAALMRERAEAATPGPWEHVIDLDVTHGYRMSEGRHVATWLANCDAGDGDIPDETAEANADYIASMHPQVGLALANWLGTFEGRMEDLDFVAADWNAALTIARLILGEVAA